jgi:hypothetical protein
MNDLELKNQLLATCPVRPGQEARAWLALKERLAAPAAAPFAWVFSRASRTVASWALTLVVALAIFDLGETLRPSRHGLVFADSQVPGIYATSFYSHSAQAQVVWLNGMDPATDKPTYLDPTSVIKAGTGEASPYSIKSPDRL